MGPIPSVSGIRGVEPCQNWIFRNRLGGAAPALRERERDRKNSERKKGGERERERRSADVKVRGSRSADVKVEDVDQM